MCGCEKHHDDSKSCTCICPEHGNFQRAYDLAMERYDEIVQLRSANQRLSTRIAAITTADEQAVLAVARVEAEVARLERWPESPSLAIAARHIRAALRGES